MKQFFSRLARTLPWVFPGSALLFLLATVVLLSAPSSTPSRVVNAISPAPFNHSRSLPRLAAERLVLFNDGWDAPPAVLAVDPYEHSLNSTEPCRAIAVSLVIHRSEEPSLWMPTRTGFGGWMRFDDLCVIGAPPGDRAATARAAVVGALLDDPAFATDELFNADAILAAPIPPHGDAARTRVYWSEPIPSGYVINAASALALLATIGSGVVGWRHAADAEPTRRIARNGPGG